MDVVAVASPADVLIVCGQGTYRNGCYYTEYADRDVYLRHALTVRRVCEESRYTHVVCSGGFTQKPTPTLSEARSFPVIWAETGTAPLGDGSIFLDELSLDSAENVYLGLMSARLGLAGVPVRRVGVYAAWRFKKRRFNRTAAALGIVERFYFHALAGAEDADAGDMALRGEEAQLKRMGEADDHLLLAPEWEEKRRARYQGAHYEHRLHRLRDAFPCSFAALDEARQAWSESLPAPEARAALHRALQAAFAEEVVRPWPLASA